MGHNESILPWINSQVYFHHPDQDVKKTIPSKLLILCFVILYTKNIYSFEKLFLPTTIIEINSIEYTVLCVKFIYGLIPLQIVFLYK